MTKYIKRIGTKAKKYAVEINLEKVELKLATAARVSVAFQRGPHKTETKNAPNLEDGFAELEESLVLPVTFYYDINKQKYLEKQGILTVSLITKKGTKVAGRTKFDLAEYLNIDIREKHEVVPILKCLDKSANFHFKITLVPFDDFQNELSGEKQSEVEEENVKVQCGDEEQESSGEIESIFSPPQRRNKATRSYLHDRHSKINSEDDETQSKQLNRIGDLFKNKAVNDFSRNKEHLFEESNDLPQKYDKLKVENDELKDELAMLKFQNERLKKNLEKDKLALEKKRDRFQTASTLDTETDFYKDKIEELEYEISELKNNNKGQEPQFDMEKKYNELEKNYKQIEQELKKYQKATASFEKEFLPSITTGVDTVPF